MKKFIALLIFAGLASAGFAKSGYGSENNNQSYDNGYQQSQNTLISYTANNSQNDYAYNEASNIREGEYDGYSCYDRWHRHHRHDRRHRHEHSFHREHYY